MPRRKQRLSKSIDTYVTLIERGWKMTWNHKEWWIIAAIAGLINTGGIFSSVFNTFWRLRPADAISVETIVDVFPIVGWLLAYVRNLVILPSDQRLLSVMLFLFFLLVIGFGVIACQHLLLRAVRKGHKHVQHISWKAIKKSWSHLHFGRLFAINAFFNLTLTLILIGTSIPLSLLLTNDLGINLFIYTGIYAIILPLTFLINGVGTFSLLYISQRDLSLPAAFKEGLFLTQRYWITVLELSIILFFINLAASLLFFFLLFIIAIAIGILFELAFVANAYLLMSFITFLGAISAVAVGVIYAGITTMLNYATWTAFERRFRRARHAPIIAHLAKLAQKPFAR